MEKNVYTYSEITDKYINELNKVTSDADIINNNIKDDFKIIKKLEINEGRHFILSDRYYSFVCMIGDKDSIQLTRQYNFGKSIVLSIKCVGENQYTMDYGFNID